MNQNTLVTIDSSILLTL